MGKATPKSGFGGDLNKRLGVKTPSADLPIAATSADQDLQAFSDLLATLVNSHVHGGLSATRAYSLDFL